MRTVGSWFSPGLTLNREVDGTGVLARRVGNQALVRRRVVHRGRHDNQGARGK